MLYRNRFRGHLHPGDPRTPVTGAGHCPWPTIPPYRIQLSSTNATGEWAFLRSRPIILEQHHFGQGHDRMGWVTIEKPSMVYLATIEKIALPFNFPTYRYWLTILLRGWPSARVWVKNCRGRCNTDVYWGVQYRRIEMGTTGNQFRQYQVEFNQLRAPGWAATQLP